MDANLNKSRSADANSSEVKPDTIESGGMKQAISKISQFLRDNRLAQLLSFNKVGKSCPCNNSKGLHHT